MANQAQLNQVYTLLQPELDAGQLTQQEIRDQLMDFGLAYKPGWAEKNAAGIRQWLAHEGNASKQRRALGLSWPAYHLLAALLAGATTLEKQRQASGPKCWRAAVNELESSSLIEVRRANDGDPRKLTLTEKGLRALA
jgi:hypothetical protein